jgi:hypothetical protein
MGNFLKMPHEAAFDKPEKVISSYLLLFLVVSCFF